jgi:hypothetical protein
MQKARFWLGTALVVIPLMLCAILFMPGFRLTRNGPVEGWVSYHGRPLAGGSILFVPEDSKETEWALAWIDEKGHYVIGSGWAREGSSSKTRFRICVIPNTHELTAKPPWGPRSSDGSWGAAEAAWWGVGDVAFPSPIGSTGFPQRLSNPRTTQLEVDLGSEPARIDVSL